MGQRKMSRRNSREGGEKFLVECEKCKQWIRGDSLGQGESELKKISFVCGACVEGKRWKKEAGEWKKAMELAKREGGEKEEEMGVWREGWESGKKECRG